MAFHPYADTARTPWDEKIRPVEPEKVRRAFRLAMQAQFQVKPSTTEKEFREHFWRAIEVLELGLEKQGVPSSEIDEAKPALFDWLDEESKKEWHRFQKMVSETSAFSPRVHRQFEWLQQAESKAATDIDGSLDIVYWNLDKMLEEQRYDDCDLLMSEIDAVKLPLELQLAFLALTWRVRAKLPARNALYGQVERNLEGNPEKKELLAGLEP